MLCPLCGADNTRIRDSRPMKTGKYRKRICKSCQKSFDTIELAVDDGLLNDLVAAATEGIKEELKSVLIKKILWRGHEKSNSKAA